MTIDEYRVAAALAGMWYDNTDHTFNTFNEYEDVIGIYDADTMEALWLEGGMDGYDDIHTRRMNEVSDGLLGPK